MVTVRSQNGWIARADTSKLTRATANLIGGTLLHFWAANEDVAAVLKDFIEEFDRRIERVAGPIKDDWSYANRLIRGSTEVVSNHGSATAVDLNALKHPRKAHNTYTKAQRLELRKLIAEYDGVLRHGEFYDSTIDGMHCEIDAGPLEVKRLADRIRARNAPKPTPPEEIEMPQTPITSAEIDRIWNEPNEAILKQTPAGAVKTTLDRVAAGNLQDRARDGSRAAIVDALADPEDPLTVWLTRIEAKIDALTPPE